MDALIFDLDDTLVADEISATTAFLKTCLYAQSYSGMNLPGFQATIREVCRGYWYKSPAREFCVQVGISSWEGLWASFAGADKNLKTLRQWAPTYRKLSWLMTLKKFNIDDEAFALQLAEKYISARDELHIVYHDVEPALESLRTQYRLGLLTNGAPDLQWKKIEATGLDEFFDVIVVSGEYGIGKPDKRIFDKMLSLLNVAPESALMVGDSLKSDVAGARAIGMQAVWLNRMDESPDEAFTPELVVKDLYELRRLLEREGEPYSMH